MMSYSQERRCPAMIFPHRLASGWEQFRLFVPSELISPASSRRYEKRSWTLTGGVARRQRETAMAYDFAPRSTTGYLLWTPSVSPPASHDRRWCDLCSCQSLLTLGQAKGRACVVGIAREISSEVLVSCLKAPSLSNILRDWHSSLKFQNSRVAPRNGHASPCMPLTDAPILEIEMLLTSFSTVGTFPRPLLPLSPV